jgi:hypothetical protein
MAGLLVDLQKKKGGLHLSCPIFQGKLFLAFRPFGRAAEHEAEAKAERTLGDYCGSAAIKLLGS